MVVLGTKWLGQGKGSFPLLATHKFSSPRKKFEGIKVSKATDSETNTKRANLSVTRKEKIKLPSYSGREGRTYHIREFLNHPSGIEAMINKNALKSFQSLDANTYRCTLHKLQLLNFEAAPTLDLRVIPTDEDFTVEMLSCKFEGSELVERQNEHFSALMINHLTWDSVGSNSYLEVDVKLNLSLEIYTLPFTLMPTAAVENPGNLMLQALLDNLVPLLLRQLVQDYEKWISQQQIDHSHASIS
ncbi:uncharacterized protein LOC111805082 [Cucurbita pepo subsp. pepo]|uniref:uncharacterized protein LOC111805082 n=1 Tax=Cucurbita pepo subsp. pepo TaxID=3664 RepID=UPI000C9D8B9B|nr:uncharacterized protein LOC111805082 [Cucurbita pepo subsp. pepo]